MPGIAVLAGSAVEVHRGGLSLFEPLDFTLCAGGLLCFEGDNGSGKSSLLRVLAGLLPLADGELRWFGRDRPPRDRLRYLGHLLGLRPELSVRENLADLARLDGVDTANLEPALEAVGLEGCGGLETGRLSAGQRKRLGLARLVLSPSSSLWLLDEPFANLDKDGQALVRRLIADVRVADGAVVYTSHGLQPVLPGEARIGLSPAMDPT